ncbi:DUF4347 domain-containing protein [Azospirillum sp. sgz302134]
MIEFIIADAGLADLDTLLGHQRSGIHTVRVSPTDDAHAILASVLAQRPAAVHLVAHGEPGRVWLGARPLDAMSLLDRAWPDAQGTEIHIHACRAGAGEAGQRFMSRLAAATGARVAAATRPLGHADQGGVWDLDVATGPIRAASPFAGQEAWPHLLAVTGTATAGNDTLIGDNTPNLINGLGGNDSLVGGMDEDTLIGGAGNDTLIGNEGNDTLNGGPGADLLNGGNNFDVATYEDATAGIVLDLGNPANNAGEAAGDTFVSIERWIGTNYDDRLVAGNSPVWFWGHAGNDVEIGSVGDDTLESGDGNDTIHAGAGNDQLFGRADRDVLYGEDGNDLIVGGGGEDSIEGGAGNDTIFGDWDADTMHGGDGDDIFYNGDHGTYAEADVITGDAGNDTLVIGNSLDAGTVSFDGGAGNDTLRITSDNIAGPEGQSYTATPQINISGMTLANVETLDLVGSARHTVTMTAAQANGFTNGITGAAVGDVFTIVGTAMGGGVTAGNGAALGAGQVQAETVNGVTLLHIGTDANPGGDVTLRFAGSFSADQFQVSGSNVSLVSGQPTSNPPADQPTTNPPTDQPTTNPPTTTPPADNRPSVAMQRIVDGVQEDVKAYAYDGPVTTLQWTFMGDGRSEVLGGSDGNDFMNLLGGNDAAFGGAGDDVLDGGSGSNWLIGGAGQDTFFVDGRNPEVTWSTVTDLEQGEWATMWGYKAGVSKLSWEEMGGADGYKGATVHCDMDGNGTIDASMTFTGKSVGAMTTTTGTIGDQSYIAFITLK